MLKQFNLIFLTAFLLQFSLTQFCYGQKAIDKQLDFIKVYSVQSFLRPPFETEEIEISNNQICHRIVLSENHKTIPEQLEKRNSIDTAINCQPVTTSDYDSIVNYILTSGLLNIDLNYTKPDITNGVVAMHSGGESYWYIIETSKGKLDLLLSGAADYTVPNILKDFDHLFRRIASRYTDENE